MGLSNPKLSTSLFYLVGLWLVSGGDCGGSVLDFFGNVVQVVGVVAVVGSDWFDGLCVCGSVDGLMIYVCVCVVMGWIG